MSNSVQTPGKVQPKTNSTWAAPVDITLTSYLIFAGKFIKIPHYTIGIFPPRRSRREGNFATTLDKKEVV